MTEPNDWYCSTLLCVDDEASVLESYRRILTTSDEDNEIADILAMAGERNGEVKAADESQPEGAKYNLLLAESGQQAIDLVKAEMAAGRRVAAGFFDMRMPGMDGYETIRELRKLDHDMLCAVVTAYTDRSVTQIREIFANGRQDELLYFKKPFSPEELEQSALNMMSSWNRKRKIEEHMRAIEKHKRGLSQILHAVSVLSGMPPHSLQYLMHGFLFQMLAFMEAEHGCSVFWDENGTQKIAYGVGRFEDREDLHDFILNNPNFQQSLEKNRCYISAGQCFMPLVSESHKLGGIYIESNNSLEKLIDLNLMEVFKSQMIQLILNSLFHHQIVVTKEEAVTDPLTGLYNRRFLQKLLSDALTSAILQNRELAVLMVDLDDFKKVNDTFGHETGDMVLKRIGNILRLAVRDYDLVGRNIKEIGETGQYAIRFGGEEFCLILLDTGYTGALQVAERLRSNIESHDFSLRDNSFKMTASIGVFSRSVSHEEAHNEELIDEFIAQADKALYKAKESGKNQVVSCEE